MCRAREDRPAVRAGARNGLEEDRGAKSEGHNPATERRVCPWCGSTDTRLVQRGFTGPTDERDQYFTCANCGQLTYELVSRTVRDMRLGQYRARGTYRDSVRQTKYQITRVLKVGNNEYLLYLKPIVRDQSPATNHRANPT